MRLPCRRCGRWPRRSAPGGSAGSRSSGSTVSPRSPLSWRESSSSWASPPPPAGSRSPPEPPPRACAWVPGAMPFTTLMHATRAGSTRPRRVGHKGAAHIEPGNTLASFDAALRHGVDMIELDVLSEHADGSGRLLVAHDHADAHARTPLTLEQALEHLAGEAFAGVEIDVDIKLPGYELRVREGLRAFGLVPRTLISGMFPTGLDRIRAAEPGLRLGWSVPRVRRDYTTHLLTAIPPPAILTRYRAALPRRARAALEQGRFDAIMAHWRVVSSALVRAVAEGGGELYVWT